MINIRDEDILRKIGANVRIARMSRGVTQEKLAEEAGISQIQISRIESGNVNPTVCTIQRIIVALEISVNDIFS